MESFLISEHPITKTPRAFSPRDDASIKGGEGFCRQATIQLLCTASAQSPAKKLNDVFRSFRRFLEEGIHFLPYWPNVWQRARYGRLNATQIRKNQSSPPTDTSPTTISLKSHSSSTLSPQEATKMTPPYLSPPRQEDGSSRKVEKRGRKGHTKSRTGCINCKRARIKVSP
jgi:hypothetical protein